jgi:hypothetical protein
MRLRRRANHLYELAPSRPTEGRLAIVTDAGRDAVDADGAARRAAPMRTAKSCGPDVPTLALTRDNASHCAGTVTNKPVTGESTKETVKTIARGMPGVLRCDRGD